MPIHHTSAGDLMIGRRGLVPLAAAVIAISASAAAAAPTNHAYAADGRLLPSVAVPVNFAPEGIAKGEGSTFYAASLATGDIYQGNLRTRSSAIRLRGDHGHRPCLQFPYRSTCGPVSVRSKRDFAHQ